MSRQDYIYQLVGKITDKKVKKKKDGSTFYQLATIIPQKEQVKKINAFNESCKKEIWQKLEKVEYPKKECVFFCKNYMGTYYLVDWKELSNSFSGRAKKQNNHGNN